MNAERNSRPLIAAGTCLGIGMGGFVDGIVFHQILQLHSMLSNWVVRDSVVNLQVNMFWDGLFHAFTWFMTALGIFLLWRAILREDVPRSGRILLGSMLLGWGLFNLIEGIIDHQILQVHHVIQDGSHILGDFLFLMSGFFLLLVGGRSSGRATGMQPRATMSDAEHGTTSRSPATGTGRAFAD